MNTTIKVAILGIIMLGIANTKSYAQRTIEGQNFLGTSAMIYPYQEMAHALNFNYGKYHKKGLGSCSLELNSITTKLDELNNMQSYQITSSVFYGYRLCSNLDRTFNLYFKAGAGVGIEVHDPWKRLPYYLEANFKEYSPLAVPCIGLQNEIYLSNSIAVCIETDYSYYFGSDILQSSLSVGFTIRYTL